MAEGLQDRLVPAPRAPPHVAEKEEVLAEEPSEGGPEEAHGSPIEEAQQPPGRT